VPSSPRTTPSSPLLLSFFFFPLPLPLSRSRLDTPEFGQIKKWICTIFLSSPSSPPPPPLSRRKKKRSGSVSYCATPLFFFFPSPPHFSIFWGRCTLSFFPPFSPFPLPLFPPPHRNRCEAYQTNQACRTILLSPFLFFSW